MASKTAAKVAIGTAATAAAGVGVFLLTRRARAAEEEAERVREEAERIRQRAVVQRGELVEARGEAAQASAAAQSAAARAARAEQAAIDAARREQYAQSLVAWTRAHAQQAGQAAQAAIDAANASARRAQAAAADARRLYAQAKAEFHVDKKAALEREAGLKDRYAQKLAEAAARDIERARQVEQEARSREEQERRAVAAEREARKVREQQVQVARTEKKEAVKEAGPQVVETECARQAVASAFQEMKAAIKAKNPSYSDQKAINIAAARMRADGIVLTKPDPSLPFWRQPCSTIRTLAQGSVDRYVSQVEGQRRARGTQPIADPSKPPRRKTATVTTTPADEARLLTEATWKAAIEYAMKASIAAGNPISSVEAEKLIRDEFRRASRFGPGMPVVPLLSEINAPSPWWAMSLSRIKQGLIYAYKAAVGEANTHFDLIVQALNPRGKVVWARVEDVQVDPNGKIIRREGPSVWQGGKRHRYYYAVLKQGVRPVAMDAEIVGGAQGGLSGAAGDAFGFAGFGQMPGEFCTVV